MIDFRKYPSQGQRQTFYTTTLTIRRAKADIFITSRAKQKKKENLNCNFQFKHQTKYKPLSNLTEDKHGVHVHAVNQTILLMEIYVV